MVDYTHTQRLVSSSIEHDHSSIELGKRSHKCPILHLTRLNRAHIVRLACEERRAGSSGEIRQRGGWALNRSRATCGTTVRIASQRRSSIGWIELIAHIGSSPSKLNMARQNKWISNNANLQHIERSAWLQYPAGLYYLPAHFVWMEMWNAKFERMRTWSNSAAEWWCICSNLNIIATLLALRRWGETFSHSRIFAYHRCCFLARLCWVTLCGKHIINSSTSNRHRERLETTWATFFIGSPLLAVISQTRDALQSEVLTPNRQSN